jgi:hypothetical protein
MTPISHLCTKKMNYTKYSTLLSQGYSKPNSQFKQTPPPKKQESILKKKYTDHKDIIQWKNT